MRRALMPATAVLLMMLGSACSSSHHAPPKPTGPVTLKAQLQFRSLTALPHQCAPGEGNRLSALPDPGQPVAAADRGGLQCYALTPAVTVVDIAAGLSLQAPTAQGGPWSIQVAFQPAQQAQITAYTTAHHNPSSAQTAVDPVPANYLAAVVDGYVVEVTDILAPVHGPLLMPVATTKADATAVYDTLTGP